MYIDLGMHVGSTISDIQKVTDCYFNDEYGLYCMFKHSVGRIPVVPYGWEHIPTLEGGTLDCNGFRETNPFVVGFRSS